MPKIGPIAANYRTELLDTKGREYADFNIIDSTRIRGLKGVPGNNQMSLIVKDPTFLLFEGGTSNFTIVQQNDTTCPVFMLPTVSRHTIHMNDQQRSEHMKKMFNACYESYTRDCEENHKQPVPKSECAATNVAGTKTLFGRIAGAVAGNTQGTVGSHFTAMIKPPGTENWSHVDPTGFLGPQRLNRKQCGGYSAMIEAQAVAKYSSSQRATADQAPGMFVQFITEIVFKLRTWFAGMRNKTIRTNPDGSRVKKALLETSYGEMADFNAQELAKQFSKLPSFNIKQTSVAVQEEKPGPDIAHQQTIQLRNSISEMKSDDLKPEENEEKSCTSSVRYTPNP